MASRSEDRDAERAPFSPGWFAELRQSLVVMARVIHAIMIREARTRYGSSQLGYLWALIDPVIILLVFIGVFAAMGRASPIDVPLAAFFLSGIIPFFYFRNSFARAASSVSANLGLIAYPQVMPADIVIGRTLLEAATTLLVFFLVASIFDLVIDMPISTFLADPADLLFALVSLFYFVLGFAFMSSGIGRVLPVWQNIINYINRPLFILSGLFFTLEQLPTTLRQYMAYNPVAHTLEWIRSAAFESFNSSSYSPLFIYVTGTIALLIGLVIDRILLLTGDEEIVS